MTELDRIPQKLARLEIENIFIPNIVGKHVLNMRVRKYFLNSSQYVLLESKMQLRFHVVQAICGYCRYLYCYC